ncbi:MAG: hypothetical protein ACLFUX_02270 [Spirochaetaceae bacterium]
MKLGKQNLGILTRLMLLTALIGTFAWALAEHLAGAVGADVSLSVGPVGFDAMVLSVYVYVNPGTVLGALAAVPVFRSI